MPRTRSSTIVARCTQRQAAADEYVPASGTIMVHAQPYTQEQVDAVYQACLDTRETLLGARTQVTLALAARKRADATMKAFDEGLRDWVATTFGPKAQPSVVFGYVKKDPAQPTAAVKAAAAEKSKATRAVRGTKGPKARLKIVAGKG